MYSDFNKVYYFLLFSSMSQNMMHWYAVKNILHKLISFVNAFVKHFRKFAGFLVLFLSELIAEQIDSENPRLRNAFNAFFWSSALSSKVLWKHDLCSHRIFLKFFKPELSVGPLGILYVSGDHYKIKHPVSHWKFLTFLVISRDFNHNLTCISIN